MENVSPSVINALERCKGFKATDKNANENNENIPDYNTNTLYSTNNNMDKSKSNFSPFDDSEDLHVIADPIVTPDRLAPKSKELRN